MNRSEREQSSLRFWNLRVVLHPEVKEALGVEKHDPPPLLEPRLRLRCEALGGCGLAPSALLVSAGRYELPVRKGACKMLPPEVSSLLVGRVRRGNYIFVAWKGDHGPRHVHVYKDSKLVVKWDLENGLPMKGKPPKRVVDLIHKLEEEGLL
ncbi:MAG: hypothetical protein E2O73_10555 [Deltaproteobacteria bacterium]|nr:MAG: hypothetical protein E2O73_10555 [Deltaproteobacteria bacterium]